jgi:hypothetical protein
MIRDGAQKRLTTVVCVVAAFRTQTTTSVFSFTAISASKIHDLTSTSSQASFPCLPLSLPLTHSIDSSRSALASRSTRHRRCNITSSTPLPSPTMSPTSSQTAFRQKWEPSFDHASLQTAPNEFEPNPSASLSLPADRQKIVDLVTGNLYGGKPTEEACLKYAKESCYDDPLSMCYTREQVRRFPLFARGTRRGKALTDSFHHAGFFPMVRLIRLRLCDGLAALVEQSKSLSSFSLQAA